MSEAQEAGGAAEPKDKRAWAEELLAGILQRMGVRARLEVKDVDAAPATEDKPATQASISVALHLEEELPGVTAGKRSPVVDSLQFLVNKIVNRGPDKRWVNIGIGGHPEPRQEKPRAPQSAQPPQQKAEKPQPSPAPAPAAAAAPERKGRGKQGRAAQDGGKPAPARGGAADGDEASLEVADDPALAALGRALAEKAAAFGRAYAIPGLLPAQRVQMSRGAQGVAGVTVRMEGEGRHRRLVLLPDNPKPMPKRSAMPDYDDEDELEA